MSMRLLPTCLGFQKQQGKRELKVKRAASLGENDTVGSPEVVRQRLADIRPNRRLAGNARRANLFRLSWRRLREEIEDRNAFFPEEIAEGTQLAEGAIRRVLVNAYERNPEARRLCIAHYGPTCCICKFNFGERYGKVVDGFTHVHHLRSLSEVGEEYTVDPIRDLRPVCPNCHAVLHRKVPAYSIKQRFKPFSQGKKVMIARVLELCRQFPVPGGGRGARGEGRGTRGEGTKETSSFGPGTCAGLLGFGPEVPSRSERWVRASRLVGMGCCSYTVERGTDRWIQR